MRGDWFAVPCKGGDTIQWLGDEALRRYYKKKLPSGPGSEKVHEVRKTKGGALLDFDDGVKDVLDDNDFVTVGEKTKIETKFYNYAAVWYIQTPRSVLCSSFHFLRVEDTRSRCLEASLYTFAQSVATPPLLVQKVEEEERGGGGGGGG